MKLWRIGTLVLLSALLTGCTGTVYVTSVPDGALVYDRNYLGGYSQPLQKGITPVHYPRSRCKRESVKVTWPDGSESDWQEQSGMIGTEDFHFHFIK